MFVMWEKTNTDTYNNYGIIVSDTTEKLKSFITVAKLYNYKLLRSGYHDVEMWRYKTCFTNFYAQLVGRKRTLFTKFLKQNFQFVFLDYLELPIELYMGGLRLKQIFLRT